MRNKTRQKPLLAALVAAVCIGSLVLWAEQTHTEITHQVDETIELGIVNSFGVTMTYMAALEGGDPDARRTPTLLRAFAECGLVTADVSKAGCVPWDKSDLEHESIRYLVWQPLGVREGRWTRMRCPESDDKCDTLYAGADMYSHVSLASGDPESVAFKPGQLLNPTDENQRPVGAPMCVQIHYSGEDLFMRVQPRHTTLAVKDIGRTETYSRDIKIACPLDTYGNAAPSQPDAAKNGDDYTDLLTEEQPVGESRDSGSRDTTW